MSFDLLVIDSEQPITSDDVTEMLERVGEDAESPASPRLAAFIDTCAGGFEPGVAVPENFWHSWPLLPETPNLVELNFDWNGPITLIDAVSRLAIEHGLSVYDPQEDLVHLPPRLGGAGHQPLDPHALDFGQQALADLGP